MDRWPADGQQMKLAFLRDILGAARDPQAEAFPLLELASAIIRSPLSPAALRDRFGLPDQPV